MPTFPVINDTSVYKQITSTFLGYNRNLKNPGDNECRKEQA